jgi:hypothetical protein
MSTNIGKVQINKVEFEYEIFKEGIRFKDKELDSFINHYDIFSIRYISLWKIEMLIYIIVSVVSFGLWWVLGMILSTYTLVQILFSYRALLMTSKGQILLKFNSIDDKDEFIRVMKNNNPDIFKISRRFTLFQR